MSAADTRIFQDTKRPILVKILKHEGFTLAKESKFSKKALAGLISCIFRAQDKTLKKDKYAYGLIYKKKRGRGMYDSDDEDEMESSSDEEEGDMLQKIMRMM